MDLAGKDTKELYYRHTFGCVIKMIAKKYIALFAALALLLAVPGLASAGYSDVVTDGTGNVLRIIGETEDDWILVENPQIDIVRVEVSETDEYVLVTLSVKGAITDSPDIEYEILMTSNDGGTYEIIYNDGECEMTAERYYDGGAFGNVFEPATDGAGTSTLSIVFTREQIGEPDILLISAVYALDESKLEVDMAGPDAEYPPGYDDKEDDNGVPPEDDNGDDNGEPPKDDNGDDSPGFPFLLMGFGLIFAVLIYHRKKR